MAKRWGDGGAMVGQWWGQWGGSCLAAKQRARGRRNTRAQGTWVELSMRLRRPVRERAMYEKAIQLLARWCALHVL